MSRELSRVPANVVPIGRVDFREAWNLWHLGVE